MSPVLATQEKNTNTVMDHYKIVNISDKNKTTTLTI